MITEIETRQQAWERRTAAQGTVDFTMMYVGHDALLRDLDLLIAAAWDGKTRTPAAQTTWERFSWMLRVHHEAEDVALWPALSAAVTDPTDVGVIAAMETEHAGIDPLLDSIGAALGAGMPFAELLSALYADLHAHMLHEESAALPLIERVLGPEGWAGFGEQTRTLVPAEQMATVLPWMLDGAPEPIAQAVLATLPPPVRELYRDAWLPAFAHATVLR